MKHFATAYIIACLLLGCSPEPEQTTTKRLWTLGKGVIVTNDATGRTVYTSIETATAFYIWITNDRPISIQNVVFGRANTNDL